MSGGVISRFFNVSMLIPATVVFVESAARRACVPRRFMNHIRYSGSAFSLFALMRKRGAATMVSFLFESNKAAVVARPLERKTMSPFRKMCRDFLKPSMSESRFKFDFAVFFNIFHLD